jgi:hypothetical protein
MKSQTALERMLLKNGDLSDSTADGWAMLDGELHFRIADVQRLDPFLVSLSNDTDLWMFISSNGGLTCGRRDVEGAVFPYTTVDELHDAHHHTGPLTLLRVERKGEPPVLWEPFKGTVEKSRGIERNLLKNAFGTRLVFEEFNRNLGLVIRSVWSGCNAFGWVLSTTLENLSDSDVQVDLMTGLQNIQPCGAPLSLYQQAGNLIDAYKSIEVDPDSGLGIVSLTAGITDRAEAVESLQANVVWSTGLEGARIHLNSKAPEAFRHRKVVQSDKILSGKRANYFLSSTMILTSSESTCWSLVVDSTLDHARVTTVRARLLESESLVKDLSSALSEASDALRLAMGDADGLQASGHVDATVHHFANTMFNAMRGGLPWRDADVPVGELLDVLEIRHNGAAGRLNLLMPEQSESIPVKDLIETVAQAGDPNLRRLVMEVLPLHFGRRHGDPSRPWNRFSIRGQGPDGEPQLHYEGNWRDIFQNWEALAVSYPGFLPNMVAKFVNASTVDGYNPYRVTREGVDWETVEPDDPWANIGYWGDHQIVYLSRLLEAWTRHDPTGFSGLLDQAIFSTANVPYRLRPYIDLMQDPSDTIVFDEALHDRILERTQDIGTDGRLLENPDGTVHHGTLFEKLLITVLSKLSNLVPDAGIWMNTQRPEWNDANNALAAGGVSVVTLGYLRRFLLFFADQLEATGDLAPAVAPAVADWYTELAAYYEKPQPPMAMLSPEERRQAMDHLGMAFEAYRSRVYSEGMQGTTRLSAARVAGTLRSALDHIDRTLLMNRREDGLWHGYNVLSVNNYGVEVGRLALMLEGQVSILSSGLMSPKESLDILEDLYDSQLYCLNRKSFLLYPNRNLPSFLDRNTVPEGPALAIPKLRDGMGSAEALVGYDADGVLRFRSDLTSDSRLESVLSLDDPDRSAILELYEAVFHHRVYTGRSGVMHGYEGLGCIYWHMVAKLLLATQEVVHRSDHAHPHVREALVNIYRRIRSGLGSEKTVEEWGAFPADPYSHTPQDGGARQPGMTGQVKEEILTRFGELGVVVEEGCVAFRPVLLDDVEYLEEPEILGGRAAGGHLYSLSLKAGELGFTFCGTPIVYRRASGEGGTRAIYRDGSVVENDECILDMKVSGAVLGRTGAIEVVYVDVPRPLSHT